MWVVLCTNHIFLEIAKMQLSFLKITTSFSGDQSLALKLRLSASDQAGKFSSISIPRSSDSELSSELMETFQLRKLKIPTPSSLSPKYAWWHRDTSDIWTSMELQTKMGGKLPIPDFISFLLSILHKPWLADCCTNIFWFLLTWLSLLSLRSCGEFLIKVLILESGSQSRQRVNRNFCRLKEISF